MAKLEDEAIKLRRKIKNQRKANRGMHKQLMIYQRLAYAEKQETREWRSRYYDELEDLRDYIKEITGKSDMEIIKEVWKRQGQIDNDNRKLAETLKSTNSMAKDKTNDR